MEKLDKLNAILSIAYDAGINLKYYADSEYTASFKEGCKEQEFELNEISFESDHDLEIEWWVWTVAAIAGVFLKAAKTRREVSLRKSGLSLSTG